MRLRRPTSLATRLFVASAILLPLLLGFSGTALHHAFQRSLRAAEKDALRGQVYILLGAAEPSESGVQLPPNLSEPRYSSINSGLIGWVVDDSSKLVWRSRSGELIDPEVMPEVEAEMRPGRERFFIFHIGDREYYALSYDTVWDVDAGEKGFRFIAMQNRAPMYNELKAFRTRLRQGIAGLAILLIAVQTIIARWALSPLRKLATDLEKVETGEERQLKGQYPADIQPVTDNLNNVLKSEQAQRERYRNTLSDLAHSLKTPLAVIRGQLEAGESNEKTLKHTVDEQISRMSAIVDHQLRRASAQVTQASHSAIVVKPIILRLTQAMQKVYANKNLSIDVVMDEQLSFHGDEADLMELVGNLIDNACKYGKDKIKVSANMGKTEMEFAIEDNGPGIPPEVKNTILTRGTRADSTSPGQGIGLAVAVDILSSYGGTLDITQSKLGGACFRLKIPN